jgi:hypothetical protein
LAGPRFALAGCEIGHAAVWGIGNGSKRKKKIWAIKETVKKAVGEF